MYPTVGWQICWGLPLWAKCKYTVECRSSKHRNSPISFIEITLSFIYRFNDSVSKKIILFLLIKALVKLVVVHVF